MVLFVLLGFYDGFYLHIWKFRLYEHGESRFEHLTHTGRAVLFPFVLTLLFLNGGNPVYYYLGLTLFLVDMVILIIDAYTEKDSRFFMGGLPRWEYIVHLTANGLHFSSIALFVSTTVVNDGNRFSLNLIPRETPAFQLFYWLVVNVLPGAVLLALLHIAVIVPATRTRWNRFRQALSQFGLKISRKPQGEREG